MGADGVAVLDGRGEVRADDRATLLGGGCAPFEWVRRDTMLVGVCCSEQTVLRRCGGSREMNQNALVRLTLPGYNDFSLVTHRQGAKEAVADVQQQQR